MMTTAARQATLATQQAEDRRERKRPPLIHPKKGRPTATKTTIPKGVCSTVKYFIIPSASLF